MHSLEVGGCFFWEKNEGDGLGMCNDGWLGKVVGSLSNAE